MAINAHQWPYDKPMYNVPIVHSDPDDVQNHCLIADEDDKSQVIAITFCEKKALR